jgi:hypothetical protein
VSDLSSDEEIVLDERIDHLLFEGVVHNDNEADNSDDSDD